MSTVVLPSTTWVTEGDAFPLRVRVPKGTAAGDRDSDLLVDQLFAWDDALLRREIGVLLEALRADVQAAIREILDL